MEKLRQYGLTAGTVAVALGIGYVMQMDATPNSLGYGPQVQAGVMSAMSADEGAPLDLREITLTSADAMEPRPQPLVIAALDTDELPSQPADPSVPELACAVTAEAETVPGAMVALTVTAPCLPGERLTVHHNGLMFSDVTDAGGAYAVTVPAFAQKAVLMVEFASGQGAVAVADVPSLGFYDRVALQWSGDTGFQLHALEFGANYGEEGHVWAGAPRTSDVAADGSKGFVTRLGSADGIAPRQAEVYTFPHAMASRDGTIALSVETEISDLNCGREIEAQALQLHEDGVLRTSDVTLTVPGCEEQGGFLVLNNLLDDLRIAAN